ncbi:NAD(P)/FAD-dependent oxidoreductase [Candidatus Parvarchaeota archaeon]|nr:NAD(P)/FAD-dependent oxidoreductase [Candidatus Parvarchaeota archaeon]
MEEVELVIIGAGPAGLFATFCASLRGIKSVTLESLGEYGGQIPELYPEKAVYDVQGIPKILGKDLAKQMYQQARTLNGRIELNSDVTDVIPSGDKRFIVEVNGKQSFISKAVLICTGIGHFSPTKLNVPGEDEYKDKGVFYSVKTQQDFKDKAVLIVGGGDSAFDYAMQIEPVAKSITIAQHNDKLKAAENSIESAKKSAKIKILLNIDVKEIKGDGQSITSVSVLDNKSGVMQSLQVNTVIAAIGHKVNPEIFKSLKLETDSRYVKVDHNYKTSVDGVYAAGDIANVSDEPKFALLAVGGAEAYVAVNNIKKYISPASSLSGGHSSSLNI